MQTETCHICGWTNVGLLNLGEPGLPKWICHPCCKRISDENENLKQSVNAAATVLAASGANPSHASLASEVARLREQVRVLRGRLEELLEVHSEIDNEDEHQTKATVAVLEATKP